MFSKTRGTEISFPSAFPMLNPPGNVVTVSSQESDYPLLVRGSKFYEEVTKGKRINIYQILAMQRHFSRFVCKLYLSYICTHLADEKTEDLEG